MAETTFDGLVEAAVRESISKILGGTVWKAVSFYFDAKLASNDPEAFARLFDKLFGAGSKVLLKVIGEALFAKIGGSVERLKDRGFQDWILVARAKFGSPSRIP